MTVASEHGQPRLTAVGPPAQTRDASPRKRSGQEHGSDDRTAVSRRVVHGRSVQGHSLETDELLLLPLLTRPESEMYRSPHESDAEHEQYNVLMLASRRATLKREVKQGAQDPDAGRRGRGRQQRRDGATFHVIEQQPLDNT